MAVEEIYERSHRYADKADGIERGELCRGDGGARLLTGDGQQRAEEGAHHEPELDQGFGLGLPGLASLTLPSQDMVVPPLNYAMVSDGSLFALRLSPMMPASNSTGSYSFSL